MTRKRPKEKINTGKIFIFCEGETERRYFIDMKHSERIRAKIIAKVSSDTTAEQIVMGAIKSKQEIRFNKKTDQIQCVFDRDDESQNSNEILNRAKKKAGNEIKLIYSNPSFEYWILCHFGYYNSESYDQEQVYEIVKSKLKFDPKKEKELYTKLKDKITIAIEQSKRITSECEKKGIELISRESTPLTLMHKIIEEIIKFK